MYTVKRLIFITLLSLPLSSWSLTFDKGKATLDKIEDYSECQSMSYKGEICQKALTDWVQKNPQDTFKAAKMTRAHMNAWVALSLFEQAFAINQGSCSDNDLKLSLLSALNLPMESYKNVVASAQKLGLETCFEQIKKDLAEKATVDTYLFKNTCKILSEKKVISGLKQKKCATL